MNDFLSQLRIKPLHYSNNDIAYSLYKAALEWDLIDPIIIEKREDLKSAHQWQDKVDPYDHQVKNLITFCRRLPVTLLADDVGLGKTISAGLVMSELISRGRLSKILIVCPKILREQWQEELHTKFDISSVIATGKELLTAQPPTEIGAVITTYHSARLYLHQIPQSGFDMLVLDEAHKLRNLYGVDPAPQVAKRFHQALADRQFKYVLMLTATPIQNRLWDIYSLVDLLTVARGHENPFGNEGIFARKFIADNRTQARQLKLNAQEEFRSIVYRYMSRIRRGDANLHFPERVVQLHTVDPTPEELELIETINEPIQQLNRLAQISILQALMSSPEALAAQLNSMARKGTIASSVAASVQSIVDKNFTTAKLYGLAELIKNLKTEQPEKWRVVIFTCRRETQTTIQSFLESQGISCGIINGDSGSRNQETIAKFKKYPPDIHVIVSTEAGSEGVNLQAANVLVNYDLPWNPMIVEQRIGRIQRLASEHEKVCIFNIVLRDTFEEYIVGRLMEKLQMASHAIGDIESLLQASGMNEDDDEGAVGFEEQIRQLVLTSLAGKDVKEAAHKAAQSIADAKIKLEQETENINAMLGGMDEIANNEPRCPKLPDSLKSMDANSFVVAALQSVGARVAQSAHGVFTIELGGEKEPICFDESIRSQFLVPPTLYAAGAPAFERLVTKICSQGVHRVEDLDRDVTTAAKNMARKWVENFGGVFENVEIKKSQRCFDGSVIVRVRVSVAHDSYERLVSVKCSSDESLDVENKYALDPVSSVIDDPNSIGLSSNYIISAAKLDPGISEFCRFYTERLAQELQAIKIDPRKRKKLEDDFTPRLEFTLVGMEGCVRRKLTLPIVYGFQAGTRYDSVIEVMPSTGMILDMPEMATCEKTKKKIPKNCLGVCEVSGAHVLHEFLAASEMSGRWALPEHTVACGISEKRILSNEAEKSAITGELVTSILLKTSALSGKRAEPDFFARCDFTSAEVLKSELVVSEISGKSYRVDEQLRSIVSGKTGHQSEFIFCAETKQPLLQSEARTCEVTGKTVLPELLEECEVTGKHVLPSKLEKSAVSGKKALKKFFVSSSISEVRLLEQEAFRSTKGKFCTPLEGKPCAWTGNTYHPDDLKICELTGLAIYIGSMTKRYGKARLEPLANLLNGTLRKSANAEIWGDVAMCSAAVLDNKHCQVESAELSPNGEYLAVSLELKTWLGLKVRYAGFLYSINDRAAVGLIACGKREAGGWYFD